MRTIEINIGDKIISLETQEFDEPIDVDDLTQIHYHNLTGESLTIPVILNRIGLLKVDAESEARKRRIESKIYEADFKRSLRKEASINANHFTIKGVRVKLSEKSLEEAVMLDKVWQTKYNNRIEAERDHEYLGILYWSISEKSKKLDVLLKSVVPESFEESIIEGEINGMYIKDATNIKIVNRRNKN